MPRVLQNWLGGYAEYTSESDSPEIFHVWCALGTVAGAAQRKIYMHTPHFDVHSNMYLALVSPPGRGKKTSALRAGKSLLRDVEPQVNFVSESGSMEGLVGTMSQITNPIHQSMTLYSMELGSIMATNPIQMVDFLTDIYDGNPDWSRQTVKHQLQTISRPWLNIMCGTTPKWLSERLGLLALEGGLIARTLLIYNDELKLDNPWPDDTPDKFLLKKELVNDLSHIATLSGEVKWAGGKDGDAYKRYDAWYRDRSRYPAISDSRTAGYYDRKHIHLLKIAMLISVSERDDLTVDIVDLERGFRLLDGIEAGMRLALNAVGRNERSGEAQAILAQLRVKGSMQYGELLAENFHNLKDGKQGLDRALEELRVMGDIKLEGSTVTWKPRR